MSKVSLHIINSCYNPKGNWAQVFVDQALVYSSMLIDYNIKFVLVNDGSSVKLYQDIEFIKSKLTNFEYHSYRHNEGKGYALRHGMKQSQADLYCYTDVDFPYEAQSLFDMVTKLESNHLDVVLGKRSKEYFNMIPLQRKIISKILIRFNQYLLRLKYPDTQCGIKLISHKVKAHFLDIKTNGFLFEVEFIKKIDHTFKIDAQIVTLRQQTVLRNIKTKTLVKLLKEYFTIKS